MTEDTRKQAQGALAILDNPLFSEVWDSMMRASLTAWVDAQTVEEREACHQKLTALRLLEAEIVERLTVAVKAELLDGEESRLFAEALKRYRERRGA